MVPWRDNNVAGSGPKSRGTTDKVSERLGWQWHLPGLSKPKDFEEGSSVLVLAGDLPFLPDNDQDGGGSLSPLQSNRPNDQQFVPRGATLLPISAVIKPIGIRRQSSLLIAAPQVSFLQKAGDGGVAYHWKLCQAYR